MIIKNATHNMVPFLALSLLVLLPGCEMPWGKKTSSEQSTGSQDVLYVINEKPVVTVAQFEEYYNQVLASDPRLQSMASFLPNLKKEIFDALANQELIVAWADKKQMFDDEEFKTMSKLAMDQVKRMYAAKKFGEQKVGKVAASQAEVRDYYDKHKDPELVSAPGGIKASGIEFDSKDKAMVFFNKVKNTPTAFAQTAKMDHVTVREFAPINKFSFDIDKAIKAALESKTSFPVVALVQASDNKWWVVFGESKQDTKYRPLEEVKEAISGAVEREKGMQQFSDEIAKLKETMTVKENAEYFEKQQQDGQKPNLEELLQQVQAQGQQQ